MQYRASAETLEKISRVDFVAVVGPSGVGKTTLINEVMRHNPSVKIVLSETSRSRRPEEIDGVDYHFRTQSEMQAKIRRGEYVQVAPVAFGDFYATAPEDYTTDGYAIMAVLAAAMPTFRSLPFRSFQTIFVLPPSVAAWHTRVSARPFSHEKRTRRAAEAISSLTFALQDDQTVFVINDKIERAVEEIHAVIHGKRRPATSVAAAHQLIKDLISEQNMQKVWFSGIN